MGRVKKTKGTENEDIEQEPMLSNLMKQLPPKYQKIVLEYLESSWANDPELQKVFQDIDPGYISQRKTTKSKRRKAG